MEDATMNYMIYCRLRELIAEKERKENRKITYRVIMDEAHIASATIAKLLSFKGIKRIDGSTIENLCNFFNCTVGDLLVYAPTSMRFIPIPLDKIPNVPPDQLPDTSVSEADLDGINGLHPFGLDVDDE